MSTTPTFITEALRLVTAILNDCSSEVWAYTALAYSFLHTDIHGQSNSKKSGVH